MVQAAATPAQPYRRHLLGLPLQRSLFAQAATAATTIGLPGLSSDLDFPARVDGNGDLFLDRAQVAVLSGALSGWFTPATLGLIYDRHSAACAALAEASENAEREASSLDDISVRKFFKNLAGPMAVVLAYGILSKFVPDVLLHALAEAGDAEPPPFPERSAGAVLMQDTFALERACSALAYPPPRLQSEWPNVSPEVFRVVSAFCYQQTGFGPLAWDSPGYEDPNYVVRLLRAAFSAANAEQIRERLASAHKSGVARPIFEVSEKTAALRRVLRLWLDFLERETWYVRRAFYVGMVPLLKRLAGEYRRELPALQLTDLLFLDLHELMAGTVEPAVMHARRQCYWEDGDYLSLHGVEQGRLAAVLGSL
ncbi:MAG: hypothetical protein ACR2G0_04755 [Chthoniobacterales bacterium]